MEMNLASNVSVFDIGIHSAKITWAKNDIPQVANYALHLKCIGCEGSPIEGCTYSCPPDKLVQIVSAPSWKLTNPNEFIQLNQLHPSTNYEVELQSIDYFGNELGQTSKLFLSKDSTRRAIADDRLELYPNPTSDELNIAFEMEQVDKSLYE